MSTVPAESPGMNALADQVQAELRPHGIAGFVLVHESGTIVVRHRFRRNAEFTQALREVAALEEVRPDDPE